MAGRDELLRRNAPYALGIVPDPNQREYSDGDNEQMTLERWRPVIERHGGVILKVEKKPARGLRIDVDGIEWELEPLDGNSTKPVPPSVYNRIKALEAEGVHFAWWFWGEEQFSRPTFMPTTSEDASTSMPTWTSPAQRSTPTISERITQGVSRRLDPIVIGIIPTAPDGGIWVLLGKWFH